MTELINFNHEQFGQINAIIKNGEYWFIGKEVAAKLGYARPTKATLDHIAKEDRKLLKQDYLKNGQEVVIINEVVFIALFYPLN